ncbi:MAG: glycosyltransferase family 39 protein [Armatimonadetes bacterium]|nr:glycosyltransferase family 39 protein [Armatimonadota bacterium]
MDEGLSLYFSDPERFPLFKMVNIIISSREVHPPAYYILLRLSILILGKSEWALRFPSVIFGILNVGLIYYLGKVWNRPITGLLGAFLLATSSFHIGFVQEARMYPMVIFLNLLMIIFISKWMLSNRLINLFAYSIFLTLSLYTHYYSILILFFIGLYVIFYYNKNILNIARWLGASLISFIFFLPWFIIVFINQINTVKYVLSKPSNFFGLLEGLVQLISGPTVILPALWIFILGALLSIILIIMGIYYFNPGGKFIGLITLGVIFSAFLISSLTPYHIYHSRYLIVIIALFCLLAAQSILSRSRLVFFLLILAWLGINFLSWHNRTFDPYYKNHNFRAICLKLSNMAKPDDGVVVISSINLPVYYYYYKGKAKTFSVENPSKILSIKGLFFFRRIWVLYLPYLSPSINVIGNLKDKLTLEKTYFTNSYSPARILILQLFTPKL